MKNLCFTNIQNVRIGKHISLEITADTEVQAKELVDQACKNLLANLIMESYEFTIVAC
jgi:phosphoribosylformylglycinamidine synthase